MSTYRQLTIWDVLDEMSEAPPTSPLDAVWQCLDAELHDLPAEVQLSTAALAFSQIAEILKSRAESVLQDVRDQNHPEGPVISSDMFAGLVRTTMQLDLDDLIEPVIPQTFKPHGAHHFSHIDESNDSLVAPVEKAKVLAMVEEVTSLEDVRNLASDEDVQRWQSAIALYLVNIKDDISVDKLQRVLKMPMVEVWLGLLLGGFRLEQRGDFYNSQDIWLLRNSAKNFVPSSQ